MTPHFKLDASQMIPAQPGWRILAKRPNRNGLEEIEEPIVAWVMGIERRVEWTTDDLTFDEDENTSVIPPSFQALIVSGDWIALADDLPGETITYLAPGQEAGQP